MCGERHRDSRCLFFLDPLDPSPHPSLLSREQEAAPLVADAAPIPSLVASYADAPAFAAKAAALAPRYTALRRTRGDGNCFFRALWVALAERLAVHSDTRARNAIVTRLRQHACARLKAAGYAEMVWEDAMGLVIDLLNRIAPPSDPTGLSQADVLAASNDDLRSNLIVMLLRFLTGAEMKARSDFFEPFVQGDGFSSVNAYVAARVDPMGEEADHVHGVALADALGVPVRVECVDLSPGDAPTTLDFEPTGGVVGGAPVADGSTAPAGRVTLLYRPGHYDILYEAGDPAVAGVA